MATSVIRILLAVTLLGLALSVTAQLFVEKQPPAAVLESLAAREAQQVRASISSRTRSGQVHGRRNRRFHSSGHEIPPNGHIEETPAAKEKQAKHPSKTSRSRVRATLPTSFDARKQWPNCASLTKIRDQGGCGTCWAVSAASVLSDRICIATAGAKNDYVSGWQTAGCSNLPSTDGVANCEDGGNAYNAFQRAALYGMNSGGELNSNVGCVPYQVGYTTPLPAIDCKTSCSNPSFTSPSFSADDTNHLPDSLWSSYLSDDATTGYIAPADIVNQVNLMKTEILNHGSIGVSIDANDEFSDSHVFSQGGVPNPMDASDGGNYVVGTNHAVKLIGWNRTAAGVEYWIGANSWNTWWGDQGLFYLVTGKNVIGVEQSIKGPIVDASQYYQCSSASFCTNPIDQAVPMNYADPSSPIYLFQGNCIQQVQISGSKLVKVGSAVPIIKKFVAGISAPVTSWNADWTDNNAPSLTGNTGGVFNCQTVTGVNKYTCDYGSNDVPSAYTVINSTRDFRYANDGKMLSGAPSQGWYIWSLSPSTFFTGNGMATVTGFLKLSATQIMVFGKNSAGAGVTGVVDYSKVGTWSGQFTWVTAPTTPSTFLTC